MEKKVASDIKFAYFLIKHIENPCTDPQTGLNIRDFYIREAERAIPTFTDSTAADKLRECIYIYRGRDDN